MITFLTGGARSGKSTLAVEIAARQPASVRLIATARADDDEMRQRVDQHRAHRPADWSVVEEPIDLVAALAGAGSVETVIVDCVTLWISNLMVDHDDGDILGLVAAASDAIAGRTGDTIVVSNEVGSGLVPMDPLGRRFRDLQGRANQRFASVAHEAFLIVSGRMLRLESRGDVI